MALTAEQQAQLEFDRAQRTLDNKMEAIRIARDILMENDRNKAVGDRGIDVSDVTTFADTLLTYINS